MAKETGQEWLIRKLKNEQEFVQIMGQAIESLLENFHLAKAKGETFFITGIWPYWWWILSIDGEVVDGPILDHDKASITASEMNRALEEIMGRKEARS